MDYPTLLRSMSGLKGKRKRTDDPPEEVERPLDPEAVLQKSIERAATLIEQSSRILLLVGAGISTSAGIPGKALCLIIPFLLG